MNRRDPHFSIPAVKEAKQTKQGVWRRWGGYMIGVALVVGLAALLWNLLSSTASTKREVAAPPMLMLPPPPPPPPEPEKLPEPPPDKVEPQVVEPTPAPVKPVSEAPSPQADMNNDPVTMNSDAQAGTDAFGVAAGRGGGMAGTGGGGLGSYGNYFRDELQQQLAKDPRTRKLSFQDVRINVWLDLGGKVTRAELVNGSGKSDIEETVLAMVREFHSSSKPPSSQKFPIQLSVNGRRQ